MWSFIRDVWNSIKVEGIVFILFLASCFTHNMDDGSLVYVSLSVVLLVLFLTIPVKRFIDSIAFLLIFFSISYVFFMPVFVFADAARLLVGPILMYLYGRFSVYKANYNPQVITKLIFLTIVFISFPVWWAVMKNILSGNIISTTSIEGARWLTTWGQSNMAAATTYGMIASFGLSGFGYFIASKNKFKGLDNVVFLFCAVLSLLITTYLINRSGIVILGLTTIIALFYSLKGFHFRGILLLLLFVGLSVYYLYHMGGDAVEILDAYSERSSITEGGDRTWRWLDALGRLFTNPFGWSNDNTYTYVHNMWLDIARVSGIVPFLVYTIATFKIINTNIRLFKKKNNELSLLLITLFTSVFLSYMIEPVIEANIFYLMIFSWIWGVEREVENGQKRVILNKNTYNCL